MNDIAISAVILAAEFALAAIASVVILMRRSGATLSAVDAARSAERKADESAASALQSGVEEGEPKRREALTTIFASTYNMEGEELAKTVDEFIARESAFYNAMANVYVDRNRDKLRELPATLTQVIAPWIRMTPKNTVDASQVAGLSEANAVLEAELAETRFNLEALMNEYSAAFDKQTADAGTEAVASEATAPAPPAAAQTASEPEAAAASAAAASTAPADAAVPEATPASDEVEELQELDDLEALEEVEQPRDKDAAAASDAGDATAAAAEDVTTAAETPAAAEPLDDTDIDALLDASVAAQTGTASDTAAAAEEHIDPPSDEDIEALLAAASEGTTAFRVPAPAENLDVDTDTSIDVDLEATIAGRQATG